MKPDALHSPVFERIPLVTGSGRENPARTVSGTCSGAPGVWRELAVELDELDDVDAGGQVDEPLLEPHQQVFDLRCLGLRLLFVTLPRVNHWRLPCQQKTHA